MQLLKKMLIKWMRAEENSQEYARDSTAGNKIKLPDIFNHKSNVFDTNCTNYFKVDLLDSVVFSKKTTESNKFTFRKINFVSNHRPQGSATLLLK